MTTEVSPDIEVEITLLPSAAGGRSGAILRGEYRGVLGVNDEHFSVRFFVPLDNGFTLGSTGKFGVQFLFPQPALPCFPVGTSFTVWEGRVIGTGKVTKVLQHA